MEKDFLDALCGKSEEDSLGRCGKLSDPDDDSFKLEDQDLVDLSKIINQTLNVT